MLFACRDNGNISTGTAVTNKSAHMHAHTYEPAHTHRKISDCTIIFIIHLASCMSVARESFYQKEASQPGGKGNVLRFLRGEKKLPQ